MALRKRLNYFFGTYEIGWEIFMVALAIIFVGLSFLPDYVQFTSSELVVLDILDWSLMVFFALKFTGVF